MNITLNIDDEIAEKVSKIAVDKNTTLTAMVLEFLASVADADADAAAAAAARREAADKFLESVKQLSRPMTDTEAAARKEAADKLRENINQLKRPMDDTDAAAAARKEAADKFLESVQQLSRPMGPRNWTREDLYDRPYKYAKRD